MTLISKLGLHTKNNKWDVAILMILFVVTILSLKHDYNFFTVDDLHWIFSAILQAFAALLAFTAAVIVFKIQNNRTETYPIVDKLREKLFHFKGTAVYSYPEEKVIDIAQDIEQMESESSQGEINYVRLLMDRLRSIQSDKERTIFSLKHAATNNTLVIIFSLGGLILVRPIINEFLDVTAIIFISYLIARALVSIRNLIFLLYE